MLVYLNLIIAINLLQYYTVGGFDNWLDAVDASFCGGDDPTQVSARRYHLLPPLTVSNFSSRMVYIQILLPVGSMVGTSSKTCLSMQLVMSTAQQGPNPVASLNLQMLSPFPTVRMKEMLRLLMHRGNVGSTLK
jgi:hypothetical protein